MSSWVPPPMPAKTISYEKIEEMKRRERGWGEPDPWVNRRDGRVLREVTGYWHVKPHYVLRRPPPPPRQRTHAQIVALVAEERRQRAERRTEGFLRAYSPEWLWCIYQWVTGWTSRK